MTINTYHALLLLTIHFVADFVLQSDEIAKNKSKSNLVLLKHVCLYTICFIPAGLLYALANGAAHFVTDWVSSRATSSLWQKGDRHNFFVIIGADQLAHAAALILLFPILGNPI